MGSKVSSEDEVRAALDALRRIVRALRLSGTEIDRSLGLSPSQLFVLTAVGETPGCSLLDVAARTHTDPSSVSAVVKKLVLGGYLQRKPSQEDARRAELRPTARGRAILAKAPATIQERLREEIDGMRGAERRALVGSLERLVRGLGLDHAPATMFFEEEPGTSRAHRG
jgi:DNA-binding MarR family transcriptional regulator